MNEPAAHPDKLAARQLPTDLRRAASTGTVARGFKYRLAYVVEQQCVLRYDNEREKGDHRHTEATEEPYTFSTPDQLMADFEADVARWNHEHGRS